MTTYPQPGEIWVRRHDLDPINYQIEQAEALLNTALYCRRTAAEWRHLVELAKDKLVELLKETESDK